MIFSIFAEQISYFTILFTLIFYSKSYLSDKLKHYDLFYECKDRYISS